MSAGRAKTPLLVVVNARFSPSHGNALRQGQEALTLARHKPSSGRFVSGLGLDQRSFRALPGHDRETLRL
jgi:hypothetical protein